MKKYLFLALLIVGGLLGVQSARLRSEKRERRRLESNQTALMSTSKYTGQRQARPPRRTWC